MRRTLVLFDLDGTLLLTGGASRRCIEKAGRLVLGDRFRLASLDGGMLDPQIFTRLAADCGILLAARNLQACREAYLVELEAELRRRSAEVKVLPGVIKLLAELNRRPDMVLGILTGNFRRAAELKLEAAGLDLRMFSVCAFAEDGGERHDLVWSALRRFETMYDAPADANQVIIIGDTPGDVACARQTGCRVVAVATGRYTLAELQAEKPDVAVGDLSDRRPVVDLIGMIV